MLPEPLLNEAQAARLLGLQPCTLRKRRLHGQPPAYVKLDGGVVRYEPAVIRAMIEAGRVEPESPQAA